MTIHIDPSMTEITLVDGKRFATCRLCILASPALQHEEVVLYTIDEAIKLLTDQIGEGAL